MHALSLRAIEKPFLSGNARMPTASAVGHLTACMGASVSVSLTNRVRRIGRGDMGPHKRVGEGGPWFVSVPVVQLLAANCVGQGSPARALSEGGEPWVEGTGLPVAVRFWSSSSRYCHGVSLPSRLLQTCPSNRSWRRSPELKARPPELGGLFLPARLPLNRRPSSRILMAH